MTVKKDFTHEERVANGRKGGLSKARNRKLRDLVTEALKIEMALQGEGESLPEDIVAALKNEGVQSLTLKQRTALQLANLMAKGDLKAISFGAKLIGEYTEALALTSEDEEDANEVTITVQTAEEAAEAEELNTL